MRSNYNIEITHNNAARCRDAFGGVFIVTLSKGKDRIRKPTRRPAPPD